MSLDDSPPLFAPQPRARSFRAVPWRLVEVLIVLGPLVALRIAPLVAGENWLDDTPDWLRYSAALAALFWMLVLPIGVARWRLGRFPRAPRFANVVIDGVVALPLLLGVWLLLFVGLFAWIVLFGQPEMDRTSFEPFVRSRKWLILIIYGALIVVIGPMAEEVLFRGMIYNALRRRLPILAAAIIQAIAFGALHQYGAMQAGVAGFLGFCLALVYEWRRSLVTPIIMHGLHNAAVLALAWLYATILATPMMGIHGEAVENGVHVTQVVPGSGADEAGVEIGDIVAAIDGHRVFDVPDMANIVRTKHAGDWVTLDLIRDGKRIQLPIRLKAKQ